MKKYKKKFQEVNVSKFWDLSRDDQKKISKNQRDILDEIESLHDFGILMFNLNNSFLKAVDPTDNYDPKETKKLAIEINRLSKGSEKKLLSIAKKMEQHADLIA